MRRYWIYCLIDLYRCCIGFATVGCEASIAARIETSTATDAAEVRKTALHDEIGTVVVIW